MEDEKQAAGKKKKKQQKKGKHKVDLENVADACGDAGCAAGHVQALLRGRRRGRWHRTTAQKILRGG